MAEGHSCLSWIVSQHPSRDGRNKLSSRLGLGHPSQYVSALRSRKFSALPGCAPGSSVRSPAALPEVQCASRLRSRKFNARGVLAPVLPRTPCATLVPGPVSTRTPSPAPEESLRHPRQAPPSPAPEEPLCHPRQAPPSLAPEEPLCHPRQAPPSPAPKASFCLPQAGLPSVLPREPPVTPKQAGILSSG
jgi:hypothetical protein